MFKYFVFASFFYCFSAAPLLAADIHSPVGQWKTIDDKTNQEKSLVEIYEENGELKGKIIKLMHPSANDPEPTCHACPDEFKNKPIVGLVFLWGLKKNGNEYTDGQILDPKNGKIYKAKISLNEDGNKLNVRGFIGFSLLGRTQVWLKNK